MKVPSLFRKFFLVCIVNSNFVIISSACVGNIPTLVSLAVNGVGKEIKHSFLSCVSIIMSSNRSFLKLYSI